MMTPDLCMVFDVESVGLHGEGFAVGYIVVNRRGVMLDEGIFACDPAMARGDDADRAWVVENVRIDSDDVVDCEGPMELRSEFWSYWKIWKARGAALFADCCWPVEARFLIACVDDSWADREFDGPYPLSDIASIRLAAGYDPLGSYIRLSSELPIHNPLADARQSARLLIEALDRLERP